MTSQLGFFFLPGRYYLLLLLNKPALNSQMLGRCGMISSSTNERFPLEPKMQLSMDAEFHECLTRYLGTTGRELSLFITILSLCHHAISSTIFAAIARQFFSRVFFLHFHFFFSEDVPLGIFFHRETPYLYYQNHGIFVILGPTRLRRHCYSFCHLPVFPTHFAAGKRWKEWDLLLILYLVRQIPNRFSTNLIRNESTISLRKTMLVLFT